MKNLPLLRKGCQPRTIGKGLAGFRLGLRSAARLGLAPLGALAATCHRQLCSTQRLDRGLVLILPGIEGCSTVNDGIAAGLAAAGCDLAVRIEDWRRFRPWNPMHLMLHQHNRLQARRIAALLSNYSHQYPGRPVHLIGHSAGAGMALFILEALADPVQIENVLLLAAAVSRKYPLNKAASRVRGKIWNFFSPLDMPTTGLGTAVFGTMDRRHSVSAGCLGFSSHPQSPPQLQQVCFQPQMVRQWNLGGHFGWTNSLFVRNQLAPLLKIHQQPGWMNSTDFGRDSNERHAERKNPRPHAVPQ
jgi:pimeloyl-ACP methyl ester carboxylesterase